MFKQSSYKNIYNLSKLTLKLLCTFSIFVIIYFITSLRTIENEYKSMIFLPISYFLCSFILLFTKKTKLLKNLILCAFSIQFLIFPLLICINRGYDFTQYNYLIKNNITKAVILQVFVFIVICITFYMDKKNELIEINNDLYDFHENKLLHIIILIVFIISGIFILVYPQILGKFRFIYMDNQDYYAYLQRGIEIKDSMPLLVYHLGFWLLRIAKLILSYVMVVGIWRISKGKHQFFSITISMIVIFLLCIFTTEDKAATIYIAVASILLLSKLYKKYTKLIITGSLCAGVIFILLVFIILPLSGSFNVNSLSYRINAYFSGTINVAAGFIMENDNKALTFLGDIFRSIPMINTFFKNMPMSSIVFNKSLGVDPIYNSEIIPMITQGYYYFGFIGSIVYPLLVISFIKFSFKKLFVKQDSYEYFIRLTIIIISFCGLFLYDLALIFYELCEYCLPLYLIILISRKRRKQLL